MPLSQFGKADANARKRRGLSPLPDIDGDELGFFVQLGAAVKENSIKPVDAALFAQFARFGLTTNGFDPSKLDARRKGLLRALQDGPAVAISAFQSAAVLRDGWSWATGLDNFGFDYPMRALVSGPYLGGNGEKEATYPLRYTDAAGQALSGENSYTITFDRRPRSTPSGRSPSITPGTSCSSTTRSGVTRSARHTGLVTAPDGWITIPLPLRRPRRGRRQELATDPGRTVLPGAEAVSAAGGGAEGRVRARRKSCKTNRLRFPGARQAGI